MKTSERIRELTEVSVALTRALAFLGHDHEHYNYLQRICNDIHREIMFMRSDAYGEELGE